MDTLKEIRINQKILDINYLYIQNILYNNYKVIKKRRET